MYYEDKQGCCMDSELPWVKRQSMWSDNSERYTEGKVVTSSGHWGRAHETNMRRLQGHLQKSGIFYMNHFTVFR